jgi:hypothetical protein
MLLRNQRIQIQLISAINTLSPGVFLRIRPAKEVSAGCENHVKCRWIETFCGLSDTSSGCPLPRGRMSPARGAIKISSISQKICTSASNQTDETQVTKPMNKHSFFADECGVLGEDFRRCPLQTQSCRFHGHLHGARSQRVAERSIF